MKTKEQIIHSMCMTYRHDYGLTKPEGDPSNIGYALQAGMTPSEQLSLYRDMKQLFDNDIAPILSEYEDEINALRKQYRDLKNRMDYLEK